MGPGKMGCVGPWVTMGGHAGVNVEVGRRWLSLYLEMME